MRDTQQVILRFHEEKDKIESNSTFACDTFTAELVCITNDKPYDYLYIGSKNYLALHDIIRTDGESFVDGSPREHVKDIRNKMTFIPAGCAVSGWTAPIQRDNRFLAIYFSSEAISKQMESNTSLNCFAPAMYFENAPLLSTMSKIDALLRQQHPPDALYAETLGLLATIELQRVQGDDSPARKALPGTLSRQQMRLLLEFIHARLQEDLSLAELAAVANLSQFHFARLFKTTTGATPHQYVLHARISLACELLREAKLSVAEVAATCGFKGAVQFNRAFSRIVSMTPSEYRRSL